MNVVQRYLALREGGQVMRNHTMQYSGRYDVAVHSFNALNLLFVLYDGTPSLNLVKAVLWHDVPAPAKWACPELKSILDKLEFNILIELGINEPFASLTDKEGSWLKGVDLLELWVWAAEQVEKGDETVGEICDRIEEVLANTPGIPDAIYCFIDNFEYKKSPSLGELLK